VGNMHSSGQNTSTAMSNDGMLNHF